MPPAAMLASSITNLPTGGGWVLEPKYDGYRLLIEIKGAGRACAWSRHGTSLTDRLGDLLDPLACLDAGWVFDGELIALNNCSGRPVQDFAAVGRAVLGGDHAARARLHYVAFDVLAADALSDVRRQPWVQRAAMLAEHFPTSRRLRTVVPAPAQPDIHARLVALGFEGSVVKRAASSYRGGRTSSWRKLKARHAIVGTIKRLARDHDGRLFARCILADGRSCTAWAPAGLKSAGDEATIIYSRVDADGSLREPRLDDDPALS